MTGPRIGELFAGYGGLGLGVQAVYGGDVVWYSDVCKFDKDGNAGHYEPHRGACRILAHRFPDVPNLGDVTKIDWSTVEPVDILTAGYPCQPFSGNGRREGTNDARHLWPHVLRAIRRLRPRLVILENVEDHLTLGFGSVLADLAEAGLDAEWCVLRASDVGAAHGRPRLFVIAAHAGRLVHEATQPRRLAGTLCPESAPAGSERLAGLGARDDADQVSSDEDGPRVSWGDYAGAVRRWERVTGRPAPAPLVDRGGDDDVSPAFVEWLMGLPAGWVTDVPGITCNEALKALGNGVVPQQAAEALRVMASHEWVAA